MLHSLYMQNKVPKGRLLIIGGAEDKGVDKRPDIFDWNKEFENTAILRELLPTKKSSHHSIEIITTASMQPRAMERIYKAAFETLGYANVNFISIRTKEECHNKAFLKRIAKAHAVLFSGGDQLRLTTILGGSELIQILMDRYVDDEDFTIAGTSAGAMALPNLMIYGDSYEAMLKGYLKMSSGLGFMDFCIIDTHFVKRGRFGRLAQAVITNPSCIGIGLGEDTALLITKGNECECRGSGMVIIIDEQEVGHTNVLLTNEGTPLCVENLKVHILCRGNGYLLREREFLPGKDLLKLEKADAKK